MNTVFTTSTSKILYFATLGTLSCIVPINDVNIQGRENVTLSIAEPDFFQIGVCIVCHPSSMNPKSLS